MAANSLIRGFTAPGYEPVAHVFKQRFEKSSGKGAALAICHHGQLVVSLWTGVADASTQRPWTEQTYGFFWSGGKLMLSAVIAHLVERGLLKYDEKISTYWPEFGNNGKEDITLDSLLAHTAGLSLTKDNYQLRWIRDQPQMFSKFLASQSPLWTPGTQIGYSATLIGLYLNEIVKRVDHKARSVSQYFQEEMALPFEIDFHLGLPRRLFHRASRNTGLRVPTATTEEELATFKGNREWARIVVSQPMDLDTSNSCNDPDFASLTCASTHGCGTAKAAAKFAGILANGGRWDGKILLTPGSIKNLVTPIAFGIDHILSRPVAFGRGTNVFAARQGDQSWIVAAHMGHGGQVTLCDPHSKVGMAYCCNFVDPTETFGTAVWKQALDAFYECVRREEGGKEQVKLYVRHDKLQQDTGLSLSDISSKL